MAIDDNTSYELTGYQVKDLAGRIRRKADANSVPTSISDLGQVTASDIDWSTMSENQSDIRKIHYSTFTATTDSNGFVVVPTNLVTPSTGMIIGASTTTSQSFTIPFNDRDLSRFTIKTESWNRIAIGNTSIAYRITYILY